MLFLSLFFCFTWFLSYEAIELPETIFSIMTLGPSGFLINWDPSRFTEENADNRMCPKFRFHSVAIRRENETDSKTIFALIRHGQVKIPALYENTKYQITVTKYSLGAIDCFGRLHTYSKKEWEMLEKLEKTETYLIEGKTKLKTNSTPAKPDFFMRYAGELVLFIWWLPCGQKRNCHGKEPGTHFYIQYKCLESGEMSRKEVYSTDFEPIGYILPGKTYEIVVTSKNGDFEMHSNPQVISLKPWTSSIRSVKAISINYTSVIISWKPPRLTKKAVVSYGVNYCPHTSDNKTNIEFTSDEWSFECNERITFPKLTGLDRVEMEIDHLQRATNYKFLIIPYTNQHLKDPGLVYELMYRTS